MLFWFRAFVILNRASSCQCVPCKDRFHEHQASRRHNVVKEENAGGLSLIVVTRRVEAEGVGAVAHLMLHSSIRRIMFVPKTTDELAMTHHCKTIIPSFGIVRKQSGEAHMTPLIDLNHMPTAKKDNCVVTAVRQRCTCIKQVGKVLKRRRQWGKRLICKGIRCLD